MKKLEDIDQCTHTGKTVKHYTDYKPDCKSCSGYKTMCKEKNKYKPMERNLKQSIVNSNPKEKPGRRGYGTGETGI